MKTSVPDSTGISRRQFLQTTAAAVAGSALLSPWTMSAATETATRTAVDQVPLGNTGLKLSRLGIGTGSNNGFAQTALGKEGFTSLIHAAYDEGVTFIDTSETYATYEWIADAIKGLPREKLFIQSKMHYQPENNKVLDAIDVHRKTFKTDYVDSLLVHCMYQNGWTDDWKRVMDGFNEARDKKWIRSQGVSCHSLPALRNGTSSDWPQVHLVRVNPQGAHIDGIEQESWNTSIHDVSPVLTELKTMRAKGRGVIGMKIIGNGDFTKAEDREKSIRYAMACKEIDAVVIGFVNKPQIDEVITRMNKALSEV